MKTKEKEFDAVKMMRDIRDKISKETMNMNFKELKEYINERLRKSRTLGESKKDYGIEKHDR